MSGYNIDKFNRLKSLNKLTELELSSLESDLKDLNDEGLKKEERDKLTQKIISFLDTFIESGNLTYAEAYSVLSDHEGVVVLHLDSNKKSATFAQPCSFEGKFPTKGQGKPSLTIYSTETDTIEVQEWAIRSIKVTKEFVQDPTSLTIAQIENETNQEVKRIMIWVYGETRYIEDAGFEVIHQDKDKWGRTRQLLKRDINGFEEPLLAIKVTNSTPEWNGVPDYTFGMYDEKKLDFKSYILKVDSKLRPMKGKQDKDGNLLNVEFGEPQELTCHNAIASTFGFRGEEYNPEIET